MNQKYLPSADVGDPGITHVLGSDEGQTRAHLMYDTQIGREGGS